jgi:sigma-B regulation protein RsbU (phosphoserine phosphatase)
MFVTLFFALLNEKDKSLTYVNAGHNPPLVYRSTSGTFEKLPPTGIALGAMENMDYTSQTVKIGKDDVVVVYTDGVTESINSKEELFGEKRLTEIIEKNAKLSSKQILETILASVNAYAGDMPQFDDITLLVVKGT